MYLLLHTNNLSINFTTTMNTDDVDDEPGTNTLINIQNDMLLYIIKQVNLLTL